MGMNRPLTVTAAICTRNRPLQLTRALDSLLAQATAPAEIMVVDNAPSDDSTAKLVTERFPGVRYLHEPVPGLDFARNRALNAATGDIVAFLDDDAVADRSWCQVLKQVFETVPKVAVCTGRIEPLILATPGQLLFEMNGGFSRGERPIRLPDDAADRLHGWPAPLIAWAVSVGCGCSYAVSRTAALQLGGFDEALDLGSPLAGGGDHDLLWRALESGWRVEYQPEAVAWHEHRREIEAAYAQIIGHQRAMLAFLSKQLTRASLRTALPLLAYLSWRLLKPGVRLVRCGLGRDPLPATVLLRMWGNCFVGLSAYPLARRIAKARRERYAA
jgi:glycosyltransferase involved in cell wall biosynthesis